MRAPISIIIPTRDSADALALTIPSLIEGLQAGLIRELVLVDAGSRDGTRAVADAAGAVWLNGPAGRAGRLRAGAGMARGDWLLFLSPGVVLAPDWSRAVASLLGAPGAWHFRLRHGGRGAAAAVATAVADLRARLGRPDPGHGLLIDRTTHDAVGGWPDRASGTDAAMARALGTRLRGLPVRALAPPSGTVPRAAPDLPG